MQKFTHINATTIEEASSTLSGYGGNARAIAGGTDLTGALKDDVLPSYPEAIVNLKTIPGLDNIKEEGGMLKIGALTSIHDIDKNTTVRSKYSSLAEAAYKVASPTIRRMGTLGGNLCQYTRCWYYRVPNNRFYCYYKGGMVCPAAPEEADNRYNAIMGASDCYAVCPSDTAIPLAALNATVVTNKRSIPILDFFIELGNVLGNDEIVTEVQVPEPQSGTKQAFLRFSLRKSIDFAIASVATAITVEAGNVTDARIVLGAVAPVPYRSTAAEDALKGNAISESVAEAVGTAAVQGAQPLNKNAYMVQIAKTLVKRAVLA
jgi:xanthine dehydrogenase YagS FAD-binding subunit